LTAVYRHRLTALSLDRVLSRLQPHVAQSLGENYGLEPPKSSMVKRSFSGQEDRSCPRGAWKHLAARAT
jgi:hypothetical protein